MNRVAVHQNRRPFEAVLQFSNVAGPVVSLHRLDRTGREREHPFLQFLAQSIEKAVSQQGDVTRSLP